MPSLISLFALTGLTSLVAGFAVQSPPEACPTVTLSNAQGTCTVKARNPKSFKKSPNLFCGTQGKLKKASDADLMANPCAATDFNSCRDYCLSEDVCHTFSYDTATGLCSLYNKKLTGQAYKDKTSETGVQHYNRHCFKVSCPAPPRTPNLNCGLQIAIPPFLTHSDVFELTSNNEDNLSISPITGLPPVITDVGILGTQSSKFYLDCLCRLTAVNGGTPLNAISTFGGGLTPGVVDFEPVVAGVVSAGDLVCSIDPTTFQLTCNNPLGIPLFAFYKGGTDTLGNNYPSGLATTIGINPLITAPQITLTASNFQKGNIAACPLSPPPKA